MVSLKREPRRCSFSVMRCSMARKATKPSRYSPITHLISKQNASRNDSDIEPMNNICIINCRRRRMPLQASSGLDKVKTSVLFITQAKIIKIKKKHISTCIVALPCTTSNALCCLRVSGVQSPLAPVNDYGNRRSRPQESEGTLTDLVSITWLKWYEVIAGTTTCSDRLRPDVQPASPRIISPIRKQ
jgi:hypothetical protein